MPLTKAKQCSEAGVITVYRDSAAPEITEVSLIPADTIKNTILEIIAMQILQ